jgi:hypothetical protein
MKGEDKMDTPDTFSNMMAGYMIIFGGIFIYICSLIWRTRSLRQEERLLEETGESKTFPAARA